jgi:hypothetical protein
VKQILLALVSLPMLAQSLPDPDLDPALSIVSRLTCKLGTQIDDAQGQAIQGKVTWLANQALTMFLAGSRSNLASTSQAPSPNGNSTITTTTSLGGDYPLGRLDLGLQYDHSVMSDLLTSSRYCFQPAIEMGSWQFGFEGSLRATDFDRLNFKNLLINTVAGPVRVSGYADLSLRDTGLGANVAYNGETWRPYASYTHYSYGTFDGATDVTRIRNADGTVSQAVFAALSGRLVTRLEQLSAIRLNRKAALLDSSATAGIEANWQRTKWGIEVNQDTDHLTHLVSTTCTGTADWIITQQFTLSFQAGATRTDAFGTNRFVGFSTTLKSRPSPL